MAESRPSQPAISVSRDQKRFAEQLTQILATFERAREWADLSNSLQKLKRAIDGYPNEPIPVKKELAKRLAQCLNPDLNVIHNQTIEVYQHIFARETSLMERNGAQFQWGTDLGLFYSGLFNFYQYAAFEVKRKFLDFVSENVLKLEKELLICLPGFLLCMIPALEDQNSELLRRVERILAKTEEIVGTSKFFGEIWKTMIRTPRARLSAIKFLDRKIPKSPKHAAALLAQGSQNQNKLSPSRYDQVIKYGKMYVEDAQDPIYGDQKPAYFQDECEKMERLSQHDLDAYCYFYYPNREHLVVNAILKGLSIQDNMDNPVYINRATFDFLITHLPMTTEILAQEEKVRILEGALLNLKLRDFASHKKFFAWFQGHLDDEEAEPSTDDPALCAIVPALKRIFLRFKNVRPQSTSGFQQEQQKYSFEIHTPLQLLLTLFDQNMSVARPIIRQTTVDLVRFIQHFYQMEDLENKSLTKLRGEVNNYFVMIKSELQIVWNALGDHLTGEHPSSSSITDQEETKNSQVLNTNENLPNEEDQDSNVQVEAINLIAFCLKDLHPNIAQYDEDHHDLQNIKEDRIRSKQEAIIMDQIIELQSKQLVPIISKLLSNIKTLSGLKMQNFSQVMPALQLIQQILEILNQRNQTNQVEGLDQLRGAIEDFNDFYVDICEHLLSGQDSRKLFGSRLQNFIACSHILCDIQRYAEPASFDRMPRWLSKVIEFASTRNTHAQRILLTSTEILLDLVERKVDKTKKDNIWRIKELVLPASYGNEAVEESPNHCMQIIQNLWSLLGESGDHVGLVSLLKRFDLLLPRLFSDVVTRELNSHDRDVKFHAVEKFNIFWKQTSNDYHEYKPFQPEYERIRQEQAAYSRQSSQQDTFVTNVSSVYDEDDYSTQADAERERSYVALHQMLLILDDPDPTLRLKCRSWLQDSKSNFLRILDPLIKEFMDNNGMYRSGSGQLFYVKNYDVDIVIENFSKMRNIILTTQEQFSSYVVTTQCSDYIFNQFVKRNKLIKDISVVPRFCTNKYIQALVMTTLSYIMGQAVESLNEDLYFNTQVVKASACEFMELILNSIKDFTDLAREIKHIIIGPIIKTLRTAIDNKNDAEQVHLLNLLRVILFDGEFYSHKLTGRKEEHFQQIVQNARNLFDGPQFMSCITDGMQNEVAFVRYHYILFAQKVVPFMKEIVSSDKQVKNIKILFQCFCDLLHCCDVSAYDKDQTKQSVNSEYVNTFEMPQTVASSKKNKRLLITQDNDMEQIIEGFKVILKDCLKIKDDMSEDEEFKQEQLKELGKKTNDQNESYGLFSFFAKSGERKRDETEILTVKRALFEQIRIILLGCLNCWNDLDVFKVRQVYFTRLGIFPYHEKDAERISDNLRDYCTKNGYRLLNEVEEQKQEANIGQRGAQAVDIRRTITGAAARSNFDQQKRILTLETYMQENFNPVQSSIISFFEPIAKSNPQQVVFGFLEIWKVSGNITQQGLNKNEACEKLIQMLLSMQIPPHTVMAAINEWITASDYITTKTTKEVTFDSNRKSMSTLQSLICHFVYTYLCFNITNYFPYQTKDQLHEEEKEQIANAEESRKQQIKLLYDESRKFFENFIWTRFPTTVCWLLEIMLLLSEKFLKHNKMDKKQRQEFCGILDKLLEKAADVCSDKFGVKYTPHYGIDKICYSPTVYEMVKRFELSRVVTMQDEDGISEEQLNENLVFTKAQLEQSSDIPCLRGSMFEKQSFVNYDLIDMPNQNDMLRFMVSLNSFIHQGGRRRPSDQQQRDINKIFTVVTLRQILSKLTLNVHLNSDDGRFHAEAIIVKPGFDVLKNQINEKKLLNEPSVKVYSEFMADLMASASEDLHFCRKYRVDIQNIFYHENFFQMSERTLRKWQTIMRHFSSSNEDLVDELLLKFSQVGGLFTSKSQENKQKAHTFKQLAFVIYSQDLQSEEQLDNLLKKMTEGFKNPQKEREMRIQLFLLSRIIMLRLPTDWLAGALKKLWPHLLAELVSVFDVSTKERDFSLTIEAIKIVELMSQLNIEDFQMNQWMFLFDGYGIDYRGSNGFPSQQQQSSDPENQWPESNRQREVGVFQPYLVKFMCNKSEYDDPTDPDNDMLHAGYIDYSGWQFNFYNVEREILPTEIDYSQVYTTEIREPALSLEPKEYERKDARSDSVQSKRMVEAEVFKYAYKLQDLLARSNVRLTKLHRQSADALIERDFLKKPRNN